MLEDDQMGEEKTVKVPENAYQPTRAEMDEVIELGLPEDMNFNAAVKRLLRPVRLRRISAEEHRARRSRFDRKHRHVSAKSATPVVEEAAGSGLKE